MKKALQPGEIDVKAIPHSRPTLGEDEIRAASEVIRSAQLSQAENVKAFEADICSRWGLSSAAAVNSGTAALHLVLLALGVGSGHEVIIPSFVCSALLHAVRYTGATPVLADIDPTTLNIDPQDVREKVTGRTRAVIVPHLFGLPADLSSLMKLNVPVIEDCAQAPGATHDGQPVGSFGHAAIFSFYATKMITSGEGGMVASRSTDLIEKVRQLRAYDRCEDDRIRYNYKMNEIQAAIGRVQMQRLDAFIERRRAIAGQFRHLLAGLPIRLPPRDPGHVYYRFVIQADGDVTEWMQVLAEKHIQCERPVFMPLHRYLGADSCPETTKAWRQCLSIPIYPSLTDRQVTTIAQSLAEAVEETGRG